MVPSCSDMEWVIALEEFIGNLAPLVIINYVMRQKHWKVNKIKRKP
jgi:hypothetical protein